MPAQRNTSRRNTQQTVDPLPKDLKGRTAPEARDLEEKILGAIMIDRDAFGNIAEILQYDCFAEPRNQIIFQAMQKLYAEEAPIDMYTVIDRLTKEGQLERVGGPYEIAKLTTQVGTSAHLMYHARIVAQKALARVSAGFAI